MVGSKMVEMRDLKVAEEVGKKAALGWLDVEFTMYGCAYLDRVSAQMMYRVSSKPEDIYDFIEEAVRDDIFPSKVETLSLKCPVPRGTEEVIAEEVKRELARQMKQKYEKTFFRKLYAIADDLGNNEAKALLLQEATDIEGLFDEERLKLFEDKVHYSYSCKKIIRETYLNLLEWIKEERSNMNENPVSKDLFEKTMYGAVAVNQSNTKYIQNANKSSVYEKIYRFELDGFMVTPIYQKTYWYNYSYRLSNVVNDFEKRLKEVYDESAVNAIEALRGNKNISKKEQFLIVLQDIETQYGADARMTVERYGHRWNVI